MEILKRTQPAGQEIAHSVRSDSNEPLRVHSNRGHERLIELDALRGLAALAVVLFHYTTRFRELYGQRGSLNFEFPLGHYGVQVFFVVSGFVIFMTLGKRPTSLDFVVSRVTRLYPVYWVSVALTFLVVTIAGLPERETTLADALVNLTMLQTFAGVPHVDGVYWTLTLELVFYGIALALYRRGLLWKIEGVALVWLILSAVTALVGDQFHIHGAVRIVFLLDWAHLFITGMVLHRVRTGGAAPARIAVLLACFGVDLLIGGWQSAAILLATISTFALIMYRGVGVLRWKPLAVLGSISYALYLTHQNIGYVVIRVLREKGASHLTGMLGAIAAVVAISYVLHKTVEQPAQTALRRLYHARNASRGVGPRTVIGSAPVVE